MKPEARLFIDCEFDGWGGRLISMALVAQGGTEPDVPAPSFYEVIDGPAPLDPWVADNVMPVLLQAPVPEREFHRTLRAFLEQFSAVHIVADYPDDLGYFTRALITGPGVAMVPCAMTFELDTRRTSKASKVPHNALADAMAIAAS